MTRVVEVLKLVYTTVRVVLAVGIFAITRRTAVFPYNGMRRLHVRTRGASSRLLARVLSRGRGTTLSAPVSGVLGHVSPADAERLADRIRQDGYVVFDTRLTPALCDELEQFSRTTQARLTPQPAGVTTMLYDPGNPQATRYDFSEQELLRFPPVQRIAVDPSIRAVAQAYLQAIPVNDMVAMWWTVAHGEADSAAAQLFHYDLDRPRFLKFFVYLTDVTEQTGPHVFVQGSHRGRPDPFYEDRRFTDDEVGQTYQADAIVELGGPRGTMMAVDTSGLHKGKHPDMGDRLVLQVEFSVSLFGVEFETFPLRELAPEAAAEVRAAPRSFERFTA